MVQMGSRGLVREKKTCLWRGGLEIGLKYAREKQEMK